jgi:hypothetical protein
VIVSKANPISKSLVFLLRVCAALELNLSLLLLLFKAQFRITENSGKRSQLCTPFGDACDSLPAPHWFFPLVLETVLEQFECVY